MIKCTVSKPRQVSPDGRAYTHIAGAPRFARRESGIVAPFKMATTIQNLAGVVRSVSNNGEYEYRQRQAASQGDDREYAAPGFIGVCLGVRSPPPASGALPPLAPTVLMLTVCD